MAENVRAEAEATLREVEAVTAVALPEPAPDVVPAAPADPALAAEIEKRKAEIDLCETQSIIRFGSAAQAELLRAQESARTAPGSDRGTARDDGPASRNPG